MKATKDKEVKKKQVKKHECCVILTCGAPSKNGQMNVEMSYEGDPVLASYLLQQAHSFLEEQEFHEQNEH